MQPWMSSAFAPIKAGPRYLSTSPTSERPTLPHVIEISPQPTSPASVVTRTRPNSDDVTEPCVAIIACFRGTRIGIAVTSAIDSTSVALVACSLMVTVPS